MLFHTLIPLQLLLLLPGVLSTSTQFTFDSSPSTQSSTLVDRLNEDPDYTSLIKLLQRARLIPTLNKLKEATLFAPTNDAISRKPLWQAALDDTADSLRDNVQEKLRQELFYHILNYTLPSLPVDENPQVHKTLLFPHKLPDAPSREPPPNPPWLPTPSGTLGDEPQRLRVSQLQGQVRVGVNASGLGGTAVVKGTVHANNGILLGINDVLDVPPDLANVTSKQTTLSYFAKIAKPSIDSMLNSTPELTLFLPVDAAWDTLPEIERLYLESEFSSDDILQILGMHAVVTKGVHWSDSFEPARNLTTISGTTLEIVDDPESGKTFVSSAELVEKDIYASNGVLHTISTLLVPPGALKLTPEKYLLTLKCTTFVSMIHSVDLTHLINSTTEEYTILAPTDEVMKLFSGDGGGLPEKGSEELKRMLSYHFLPGKWAPEKLKDGMLVQTALEEEGLGGARQVLDVAVSGGDKEQSIRFGGASVLGEKVDVEDKAILYLVSRPLLPPADVLQTALPTLDFSTFLSGIFSTSLAEQLKTMPSSTFLMPVNDAFKRLGMLVSAHLLQASSKSDLEKVILHHVINGVEYTDSFESGSTKSYGTHEGTDLRVHRSANGSIYVSPSGGWAEMNAEVTTLDLLTKTGVIHQLSDILLPRSVNLTIGKLVKAAKGSTMAAMLTRADMEWVLSGTAPPDDSKWADPRYEDMGWTLLCPTDEAFKGYNLTKLYEDTELLRDIVEQHLIPMPSQVSMDILMADASRTSKPLVLDDSATYNTLHSLESAYGDIVFRQTGGNDDRDGTGYLVGIKGARGTESEKGWARVLSWGRSTTNSGTGGVIQIDRLLVPYRPPWYVEYGAPTVVGVLGVILICLFFLGVRAIWRRDTTEATYEPIGGFGQGDDEP